MRITNIYIFCAELNETSFDHMLAKTVIEHQNVRDF